MDPTLLIAGHGYLGQEVSRQTRALGIPTVTLTRSGENADLACDLTDPCHLQALAKEIHPTHILACASSGRGSTDAYRNIFLHGTQNLLESFPNSHLTFTSSTSVYRHTDGSTVTEDSNAPTTLLSSTSFPPTEKSSILLAAEQLTLAAQGTVLRLAGIYGPHRSYLLQSLLRGTSKLEKTDSGLGTRILNQIHVADAAKAVLHLIRSGQTGLYNVSDNHPTTQLDLLTALCRKLDLPLPETAPPNPNTKRGWTNKAVSNKKLLATSWTPSYPEFLTAFDQILPTLQK